jgi:hypothetical protein
VDLAPVRLRRVRQRLAVVAEQVGVGVRVAVVGEHVVEVGPRGRLRERLLAGSQQFVVCLPRPPMPAAPRSWASATSTMPFCFV